MSTKWTHDENIEIKKMPAICGHFSFNLAERTGLEPATPDVTGRYSNQLNYHSLVLQN
jgi:hypothetical protein